MVFNLIFGDCAELRSEQIDPGLSRDSFYIGLEHIEQQSLSLSGHGFGSDVDSQKQRFYEGDILFGRLRPYFRKVVVAPFDGICSTEIWVVKPKSGIDRNFVFYWMASEEFITSSTLASEGGRMPRANWGWVSKFLLPNLGPSRQSVIGQTLGALDAKIEVNKQLSKTLENIIQTVFKSWFIDFDPVKAKVAGGKPVGMDSATAAMFPDSMEDSELGLIPIGWKPVQIGELVVKQSVGKVFGAKTGSPTGEIPILDQRGSGKIGYHNEEPGFIASPEQAVVVFGNHSCVIRLISYPFSAIQNVFPLLGNEVEVIWLYFAVLGKQEYEGYRGHWPDFVVKKALRPPIGLTSAFHNLALPFFKQKWVLDEETKSLTQMRDALLPRLISGELHIPEEMLVS